VPRFRLPQNKGKLYQGTQRSPQEPLKEEILKVINENFIEMLLDMANQNIREALKFQDNKIKEYENTQTNKS
jgi:hypothetical protein